MPRFVKKPSLPTLLCSAGALSMLTDIALYATGGPEAEAPEVTVFAVIATSAATTFNISTSFVEAIEPEKVTGERPGPGAAGSGAAAEQYRPHIERIRALLKAKGLA